MVRLFKTSLALGAIVLLTACNSGGQLTLEPGARKINSKGSPFVQVNQGGKALVVETAKTPTTGVHGWVAVQAVASGKLNGGGMNAVMNKTSAYR